MNAVLFLLSIRVNNWNIFDKHCDITNSVVHITNDKLARITMHWDNFQSVRFGILIWVNYRCICGNEWTLIHLKWRDPAMTDICPCLNGFKHKNKVLELKLMGIIEA